MLAFIPSPPGSNLKIGPLQLHVYGALIVIGVLAAVWLADRRWRARGGEEGTFSTIAMWAVPGGLIGARLYHVATDYELYTHHLVGALEIWNGGLGIWGGVAGGVLAGWICVRRHNLDFAAVLDCAAPALPLAQAIGRWGNYFNQELFGRPSTLPWALKVDAVHRPTAYASYATFHPTFLYESIWDLVVVALVLLVERRVRLRKGYLFLVYVSLYTFGRFFTEYLRIDFAHKFLGLRINDWTSIVVFVVATFILVRRGRERGERVAEPAGGDGYSVEPSPVAVGAGQAGSTLATTDLHGEIRPPTDYEANEESASEVPSVVEMPAPPPPAAPEAVYTPPPPRPAEPGPAAGPESALPLPPLAPPEAPAPEPEPLAPVEPQLQAPPEPAPPPEPEPEPEPAPPPEPEPVPAPPPEPEPEPVPAPPPQPEPATTAAASPPLPSIEIPPLPPLPPFIPIPMPPSKADPPIESEGPPTPQAHPEDDPPG